MTLRTRLEGLAVSDKAWNVRDRLKTALPALVLFAVLGMFADATFWQAWWFYVGLGIFLSGVFFEPYFGTPRTSIANAVGAVGATWSADRTGLEPLWWIYFSLAVMIFAAAVSAAVLPGRTRIKQLANKVALWGSAATLGTPALLLESARHIAEGDFSFVYLAIGTIVLLVGVAVRWSFLTGAKGVEFPSPVLIDSIGPGLLLVEGLRAIGRGAIAFIGPDRERGTVVAHLPGPFGPRTILATESSWANVAGRLPESLAIQQLQGAQENSDILGIVSSGSTINSLEFPLLADIEIGTPVMVGEESPVIFQVSGQRLAEYRWDDSRAVIPTATAIQVGQPHEGFFVRFNRLQPPHAPLRSVRSDAVPPLPGGYLRLGVLKGTSYPIGFALDDRQRGHMAVLGVSGMGKTSSVRQICEALGADRQVLALDVTGEYFSSLRFPRWVPGDFRSIGHSVYEPSGVPARAGKNLITEVFNQAKSEYSTGAARRRTICLEEAHSFVPEWNFATRDDSDDANAVAKIVMQARKFGLTFLVVSQRTAVVSKSVLSQCESFVAYRCTDETSLTFLETVMGHQVRDLLPALERYDAVCFGPGFNADGPVVVTMDPPRATAAPTAAPASEAPF